MCRVSITLCSDLFCLLVVAESWEGSCESHQVKAFIMFKGLCCFAEVCVPYDSL